MLSIPNLEDHLPALHLLNLKILRTQQRCREEILTSEDGQTQEGTRSRHRGTRTRHASQRARFADADDEDLADAVDTDEDDLFDIVRPF